MMFLQIEVVGGENFENETNETIQGLLVTQLKAHKFVTVLGKL